MKELRGRRCGSALSGNDVPELMRRRTLLRCGCRRRLSSTFAAGAVEKSRDRARREATQRGQPFPTLQPDNVAATLRPSIARRNEGIGVRGRDA